MTAALGCVVVVVVGMVIVWKTASGALVVGPTNPSSWHAAVALFAPSPAKFCSVTSIRAAQPTVARVRHSIASSNTLPNKTHVPVVAASPCRLPNCSVGAESNFGRFQAGGWGAGRGVVVIGRFWHR